MEYLDKKVIFGKRKLFAGYFNIHRNLESGFKRTIPYFKSVPEYIFSLRGDDEGMMEGGGEREGSWIFD